MPASFAWLSTLDGVRQRQARADVQNHSRAEWTTQPNLCLDDQAHTSTGLPRRGAGLRRQDCFHDHRTGGLISLHSCARRRVAAAAASRYSEGQHALVRGDTDNSWHRADRANRRYDQRLGITVTWVNVQGSCASLNGANVFA